MFRGLVTIAAFMGGLFLSSCQSNDDPMSTSDVALTIAANRAFDVLNIYVEEQGALSAPAIEMIDATAAFTGTGCKILLDETMTPAERYVVLETENAANRARFAAALAGLAGISAYERLAISSAQDLLTLYASRRADPAVWSVPCLAAERFAVRWARPLPA